MVERKRLMLTCPICQQGGFKNLTGHVLHGHKLTIDDFRQQTEYDGPMITAAQARLMAARSNALWSNPDTHKRRVDGIKASYTDELRTKRSDAAFAQWDNKTKPYEYDKTKEMTAARMAAYAEQQSPMTELRSALRERANSHCEKCGKSEDDNIAQTGRRLHLHHLNYDRVVPTLEDVQLLCSSCHHRIHGDGHDRERFPMVARLVGELLKALRVDLTDENFIETPRRVATFLLEHFPDGNEFDQATDDFSAAVFPSEYDGMVVQNIQAVGMCPHHLLPVLYEGVVAYMPDKLTIGLSKLSRIAQLCLSGAVLQEFGTLLVTDMMADILQTENVAAVIHGSHTCMMLRGVKAPNSFTQTSELRGSFREHADVRAEFMTFVQIALRKDGR